MKVSTEAGEHILYSYQGFDGENSWHRCTTLVTNRRLVLGNESWPLEDIAGVEIVTRHKKRPTGAYVRSNENIVNVMEPAAVGLFVCLGLSFLTPKEWWFIWLLLEAIIGLVFVVKFRRALKENPQPIYRVKLKLRTANGEYLEYEPRAGWEYAPPARRTVEAVRNAINNQPASPHPPL